MPQVPRYLRRRTFCATNAIGDERHCVFDCPHSQGLRQQHAQMFQDSHEVSHVALGPEVCLCSCIGLLQDARDSMRSLVWHQNQKALSDFVIAVLDEPRT